MKEFKYTIDGKEYQVAIQEINENNVASICVNGEEYKVQLEQKEKEEKKKVVLGKPAESSDDAEAPVAAANINANNAVKAPLPGTITAISVEVGQEVKAGDTVVVLGKPAENSDDAEAPVAAANINASNAVKAPLPGTITAISVEVGQEVKAGETLVVLEAMKMANSIEAEKDGKVTAICVKVGQSVLEEDPLVVVE